MTCMLSDTLIRAVVADHAFSHSYRIGYSFINLNLSLSPPLTGMQGQTMPNLVE